jgi:hypothetical protein
VYVEDPTTSVGNGPGEYTGRVEVWSSTIATPPCVGIPYVVPEMVAAGPPAITVCAPTTIMEASMVGFVAGGDIGPGFAEPGEIATGAADEVTGPGFAGPDEIATGGGDKVGLLDQEGWLAQ